jgi:hypothetical protein
MKTNNNPPPQPENEEPKKNYMPKKHPTIVLAKQWNSMFQQKY